MITKIGDFVYDKDDKGNFTFKVEKELKKEKEHIHKDPVPYNVIGEMENESRDRYKDCLKSSILEIAELLIDL